MKITQSNKFRNFAITECKGSSRLYEFLSLKIAEDDDLLELASHAREGQPSSNLIFGAVHYLLLQGMDHPLREFYPSLVKNPRKVEESFLPFKNFCLTFSEEIVQLLKEKLVQTNEVRRCSYLFPAFQSIYDIAKKPLALIEIGTSAGLQLLWDQYSYSYGTDKVYGNKDSALHITAEVRGDKTPNLQDFIPPVAARIGIDLHPIDLRDNENALWLKALIWPEHHERRALFEKAAEYVKANELRLIKGNGVELIRDLSSEIPKEYAVCVFHTHVANQMPSNVRTSLLEQVQRIGAVREIFHLYNNILDRNLHLDYYLDGKEYKNVVGETEGHGSWFTWEL
ncbi:DUF2332 domain-containing protein [Bacillus sp. REN16]|uniref:DUF2332 domain-containing protein n=1 Tax=Bacillus sp. REN16 TaxID=2887296 RepID=UPI001E2A81A6|nr:DUF2332 domain-containing protein [Bacillus sp. REN16]MCC3356041.1 DUF2332 domain-containing protein [Bacillus sp. REN16]